MTRRAALIALGFAAIAALAVLLALHRSYSPGPLSRGHQPFATNCAACHQPWRGVEVASIGCVDCHGSLPHSNKHADTNVTDKSGAIAGATVVSFHDRLACMSCHTDHVGVRPNLAKVSGENCASCHFHPSIKDVAAHQQSSLTLIGAPVQLFEHPFSHLQHLDLINGKLKAAREKVQRLRSPRLKQQAEADIASLTARLDSSGKGLRCLGCHVVEAWSPEKPDKFSFATAGCVNSTCHNDWHDSELKLTSIAPQFVIQQTVNSPAPAVIDYVSVDHLQFVKASFHHSAGHLRADCAFCHADVLTLHEFPANPSFNLPNHVRLSTDKLTDTPRVANCFGCHEHQPPPPPAESARSGALFEGVAQAEIRMPSDSKVTGCAQCHAFHLAYTDTAVTFDFSAKAPIVRPHPTLGPAIAGYSVLVSFRNGPELRVTRAIWRPWSLALGALAMLLLGGFTYVRYLPRESATDRTQGGVAPQRSPEIPALDENYQSTVSGLYVVGETAGTASINYAMRSGDETIKLIANQLRGRPQPSDGLYQIAIVGCGPAGIGAATSAKSAGLKYLALEQTTAASTVRNYPRKKLVQSTPIEIGEYGKFMMEGDASKEEIVKKWEEMLATTQVVINERQEVTTIRRGADGFEIATRDGSTFRARYVVLAIGLRGSPRKLNLPGETPDRVFYNLIEPQEYKDKHILIVGGGNAGAEVTQMLAAPELRNIVSYSIRDAALRPPVTPENAQKISELQTRGFITLYPSTQLTAIKPGKVVLQPFVQQSGAAAARPGTSTGRGFWRWLLFWRRVLPPASTANRSINDSQKAGTAMPTQATEVDNDVIFAMLGAELPTRFLKAVGLRMIRRGH